MSAGKCPKCGKSINELKGNVVNVSLETKRNYKAVAYSCPNLNCKCILGVEIDPIILETDIINGVIKKIKQMG